MLFVYTKLNCTILNKIKCHIGISQKMAILLQATIQINFYSKENE